jgi:hypothetical protein
MLLGNYFYSKHTNSLSSLERSSVKNINRRYQWKKHGGIFRNFVLENIFSRDLSVFEALDSIILFPKQFGVFKFLRLHFFWIIFANSAAAARIPSWPNKRTRFATHLVMDTAAIAYVHANHERALIRTIRKDVLRRDTIPLRW